MTESTPPRPPASLVRRVGRRVLAAIGVVPPRGTGDGPGRPYVAGAVAGVARVRAAGHDRPIVLVTWPLDTQNPFQALLTSRAEEAGIVPI